MLRLLNVSLARGTRVLYSKADLIASDGERIGLVGPNGCGKSTLFAAVLGELSTEDGEIEAPPEERIAHVAQNSPSTDEPALQFVLGGHAPLARATRELEAARAGSDDMRLAAAEAQAAELNPGAITANAKAIMHGLGFSEEDASRPVRSFSGGWRNRLALARALMRPADLLLLDEPTNHLDLDSVIWLESWLRRLQATVIIISHDREFLDRAVSVIWSVEDGTVRRYSGNYSAFEALRIERLRQQQAGARAYERTAAHLQAYIDRFRYKATKARQAQSRIKMLEKLQAVEPVRARTEWRFEFPDPERLPDHLVDAEQMDIGYDGSAVLRGVTFCIRAGERIGVLGVNGAGKSTLVKAVCGILPLMKGELRRGQGLAIGYFAQHQLDSLRPDETALQHLRRKSPDAREQELRDFLGKYRFSGDRVDQAVAQMSGGEKARLALALIAWDKPNLLVLDEPTNHLDMETREALTLALSTFSGSVLTVSHDRHLLRAAADKLWLVREGAVKEFDGDLDDYAELVLADRRALAQEAKAAKPQAEASPAVTPKEARREAARERARVAALRKPFLAAVESAEKRMAEIDAELEKLDRAIADPAFFSRDPAAAEEALRARGRLAAEKDEQEEIWMEASEKLEAIA